jgi:hypothetical protein
MRRSHDNASGFRDGNRYEEVSQLLRAVRGAIGFA